MAATDVTAPTRPHSDPPPPRRRAWWTRLSGGHLVVVAAAMLAALANVAVIRGASDTVPVLVAAGDIGVGETITPRSFRTVEGRLDADALKRLLRPGQAAAVIDGSHVAAVALREGDLVRATDTRPAAAGASGLRRISFAVPADRAVGGRVGVEDRIDVIHVDEGVARYLVTDVRVVAVSDGATGRLGPAAGSVLTVAVDAEAALCLAAALDSGEVTVVLSTGSDPVIAEGCRPGEAG